MDYQAQDSYYVVAHLHYVLFGGTVFGIFAGTYFWFPKITGRMYDEGLAKAHFWLLFIGFNAAFLPQHMLGLMGMPRRIYTYDREGLFEWYNLISTLGAFLMGIALLVFVWNAAKSWRSGPRVEQRSLDGGHARVVRDLAAAGPQLRRGPLRLEPAAAARPAPAAQGAEDVSTRPGPWLRLTAIAATAGVAAVVATGSWGLAHDVTAHVTLALLAATALTARLAHPDRPDLLWSAGGVVLPLLLRRPRRAGGRAHLAPRDARRRGAGGRRRLHRGGLPRRCAGRRPGPGATT